MSLACLSVLVFLPICDFVTTDEADMTGSLLENSYNFGVNNGDLHEFENNYNPTPLLRTLYVGLLDLCYLRHQ